MTSNPTNKQSTQVPQGDQSEKVPTQVGTQMGTQAPTHEHSAGYPAPAGEWLTLKEAAEQLGVSMNTIRRKLKAGEFAGAALEPSEKGARWLLPASVVAGVVSNKPAPASTDSADLLAEVVALRKVTAEQSALRLSELQRLQAAHERELTAAQHRAELAELRADSHESVALERLRVLQTQELALALAQRKVLELETASAKRTRWWQRAPKPAQSTQAGVVHETTESSKEG
jgi:excisionase family DNA binding protein